MTLFQERLKSLQKKQKHIRDQRKMAAAEGFANDTDDLSQESENEFLTAEDSSEVESDIHDDQPTDDVTSDERGMLPDVIVKSYEWYWHKILK